MTSTLSGIAPYMAFGGSAGAGFVFIRWLLEYLGRRWDKRESVIDTGTQRLIDRMEAQIQRLTERLDKVEDELAECKQRHAESAAEVLRLQAVLQARGEVRERAALIVAADKAGARK